MIEKKLDVAVKAYFQTWGLYAVNINQNPTNLKRKIVTIIKKLNAWLLPLNLHIELKENIQEN
jgi:hypothetical protein